MTSEDFEPNLHFLTIAFHVLNQLPYYKPIIKREKQAALDLNTVSKHITCKNEIPEEAWLVLNEGHLSLLPLFKLFKNVQNVIEITPLRLNYELKQEE